MSETLPALELRLLPETYAVAHLPATASTPAFPRSSGFVSVTRTEDELSVICPEGLLPDGAASSGGFRCLRMNSELPFDCVGVVASIAQAIASAGLSVFAVSTHDRDYFLVAATSLDDAVEALRARGHAVVR
jgi:hypothetical protein